ncbi:MAG TPA: GNAT family N-acetyltransferase [Geminicoccus sp.]|uniref:GNAT family N-acetyltransferase n=1 Tax=Geminicoccus sp. TaxID=2024832 RepID=UPI002B5487D1|nr:GNAT family N-acetyltransferase [Geminicoccus sp.]HWL67616.1 GNAT family N-acetyltransferase [Geminicoccus sp.]
MTVTVTNVLEAVLPARGRVLDVGCADGGLVRWLGRHGFDAQGVDPQADGPELLPGVAEALPVASGSVDAVLFVNSLHHVPVRGMDQALGEAARVLRPGGRLVVVEPLPEGEWFEILRPVEDETGIRNAAAAALERAEVVGFVSKDRRFFEIERRAKDVASILEGFVAVDPERAAAVVLVREAVEVAFARHGQAVEDGRAFRQPMRADVLELPANAPIVRFARDEADVAAALEVRCTVFCDEQGVALAEEIDGLDDQCRHLVATVVGRVVGTARLRAYGPDGAVGKIERVALLKEARGLGLGQRLVRFAAQVLTAQGHATLLLNAQTYAQGFYARLGFRAEGEPFDDAGIPHVAMWRSAGADA